MSSVLKSSINNIQAMRTKLLNNKLEGIILLLTGLLLVVAPFFRGLYFRENYIPAVLLISCLFILTQVLMLKRKNLVFVENYIDIGVILLVLSYFLSFIFGISKMDSLDGLLKYIGIFFIYKSIFMLVKNGKHGSYYINVIIVSGFVTSIFSMLGSAELIKLKGVFGWGDRLNGLYQYPNSTAAVLAGIFLLSIIVLIGEKKYFIRLAYLIGASTMMLTFLETRSRGGLLVLGAAWLGALLLLKGSAKLNLILYSGIASAPGFLMYSRVYNTFIDKKGFVDAYILFLIVVAALGFAIEFCKKYIDQIKSSVVNKVLAFLLLISVIAAVGAFNIVEPLELNKDKPVSSYEVYSIKPDTEYIVELSAAGGNLSSGDIVVAINSINKAKVRTAIFNQSYIVDAVTNKKLEFKTIVDTMFITVDFANNNPNNTVSVSEFVIKNKQTGEIVEDLKLQYKFIPDDIAKKINEISLKTDSSSERLVFIKDGLKIFKDYFLFGTGANGWSNIYTQYQSYGYVSKEAHNFYLQTAIESGLFGILSLLFIMFGLIVVSYKAYKNDTENNYAALGTAILIFTLLSHAFIDFDFSIYSILLLLFASIGAYLGIVKKDDIPTIKYNFIKIANALVIIASIATLVVTAVMYSGMTYGNKASRIVSSDSKAAKQLYERAMSKGFYNMAYIMDYNQLLDQESQRTGNRSLVKQAYDNYKLVEINDPYNISYYSVMLKFYIKYGYVEDAQALAERFVKIQPFNPASYEVKASLNHSLMNFYNGKKDYAKTLDCANIILEIERQHDDANKRTIVPFELTKTTQSIIKVAEQRKEMMEKRIK